MTVVKKYLVIGGTVQSKTDFQYHYVGPATLCVLYDIHPSEAFLANDIDDVKRLGLSDTYKAELTILQPRYDGNYSLGEITR